MTMTSRATPPKRCGSPAAGKPLTGSLMNSSARKTAGERLIGFPLKAKVSWFMRRRGASRTLTSSPRRRGQMPARAERPGNKIT